MTYHVHDLAVSKFNSDMTCTRAGTAHHYLRCLIYYMHLTGWLTGSYRNILKYHIMISNVVAFNSLTIFYNMEWYSNILKTTTVELHSEDHAQFWRFLA